MCTETSISLISDHMGDLAAPVTLAGLDWSSQIASANYYGYGYKWLWFIIFRCFSNPYIIYTGILLFNKFIISLCGVLIYHIEIFYLKTAVPIFHAILFSIIITAYAGCSINSEGSLFIAGWITVYLLLRIIANEKKTAGAVISALWFSYALTLHTRMAALIISFICLLFIYRFKFKKWIVSPVLYMILQFLGYLFIKFCNAVYCEFFWGERILTNASALNPGNNPYILFSLKGLQVAVECLISNLITLTLRSYGICWIAIVLFFISIIFLTRSEANKLPASDKMILSVIWMFSICILIIICGLVVNWGRGTFTPSGWGYKGYTYARYYICFSYPIIIAVISWMLKHQTNKSYMATGWISYALCIMVFLCHILPVLQHVYEANPSIALERIMIMVIADEESLFVNILIWMAIATLLIFLVCRLQKKRFEQIFIFLFFMITVYVKTFGLKLQKPEIMFSTYNHIYDFFESAEESEIELPSTVYSDSFSCTLQFILNRFSVIDINVLADEQNYELFVTTFAPETVEKQLTDYSKYYCIQIADHEYVYTNNIYLFNKLLNMYMQKHGSSEQSGS